MAIDGSKLQREQVFGLTMFHCVLQGVLVSMICGALASRPGDSIWLRVYVVVVNLIALLQTIAHVIQGFSDLEAQPPYVWLELLLPRLTAVLSASAQLFFIHRCWRILQRRWLPIIPFCTLFIAALIPGVVLGTYAYPTLSVAEDELARIKVHFTIWIFCSFILDLTMTATTVVYLWRTRVGLKEHSNVFVVIWSVLWASAAPPLILMSIAIIDGYMTKVSSHPYLIVGVDITGKFFVLSVMINLCGRNLIQERLRKSANAQSAHSRNQGGLGANTIPVMIQQEKTTEYELKEWPATPSLRIDMAHGRVGGHSEDTEAKGSSNELVVDVPSDQVKQLDLFISEERRLPPEQRLGRQV